MILAIDIGNSRVKAGLRNNDHITSRSADTYPFREADAYLKELGLNGPVDGIIISTVVDELKDTFKEFSSMASSSGAVFVDSGTDSGIRMSVERPEQVGPDRIANAVAGYHIAGGPVIIVDIGSATTLTVVGRGAEFMGGCIMPGVEMMATSLEEKTAKLPKVDFDIPRHVIGRDTAANINAGLSYGVAGAIERLIAEIKREIGYTMNVILTGGMSGRFEALISGFGIIDPLLTLKGLFIIYDRVRG